MGELLLCGLAALAFMAGAKQMLDNANDRCRRKHWEKEAADEMADELDCKLSPLCKCHNCRERERNQTLPPDRI